MNVFLIRHGRSTANDKGLWTGQTDVSLSQKGIRDLQMNKKIFPYPEGDFYVTSPLKRCIETMEVLYGRAPDVQIADFLECSLGILEGTEYTDLTDDSNYTYWLEHPEETPFAEGESFSNFKKRTANGFKKMLAIMKERNKKKAVVVMHGNVIRSILNQFADNKIAHKDWLIPNGVIWKLDIKEDKIVAYKMLYGGTIE